MLTRPPLPELGDDQVGHGATARRSSRLDVPGRLSAVGQTVA